LHGELNEVLNIVFKDNKKVINDLEAVKTVAGWYSKIERDKKKIPSIITNEAISWLIKNTVDRLSKSLSVKLETEIGRHDSRVKQLQVDFSLQPYVEYVLKVDGVDSKIARITFNVALFGILENIRFPSSVGYRHITIEKFSASLTLSIIKVAVYVPSAPAIFPLNKPIMLCEKQLFKAENLSFYL
jgi:hypothetical protein